MPKPTRTTNPLHFEDLDPRRFEDLALALVYRMRSWEDIHHDGRAGSDDGADIRAIERLDDGSLRHWAIQCKRYRGFSASDARDAISKLVKSGAVPPDVALLVVGCDVSLATRAVFEAEASIAGIGSAILWTASKLEAMLYADHPDLLFGYFGISLARRERSRESNIRRGLVLKRKLRKVFPKAEYYPNVIIRSVDDESYPRVDDAPEARISSWFKTEVGGHYHNGLELYLRIIEIIVDREDGRWATIDWEDPEIPSYDELKAAVDLDRYARLNVVRIGRIPFRNIVEIDEEGDEYYPSVHLFCRFTDSGMPYESTLCRELKGFLEFHSDKQFPFKERIRLTGTHPK